MTVKLEALKISAEQIESLSGVDVSDVFVGGIFGGAYRPSVLQHSNRLLLLGLTEILVIALMFAIGLPIALFLSGSANAGIKDLPSTVRFLQIAIALTAFGAIAWNLHMRVVIKRFKLLMALLDEIDRYNQVIHALSVLTQLETVQDQIDDEDRSEILAIVTLTRENLVSGLATEKILRENRGLLIDRPILVDLEQSLATLQTLEMKDQASEYSRVLGEALRISMSVHREVQKFSRLK
jgi:hypothetical protein